MMKENLKSNIWDKLSNSLTFKKYEKELENLSARLTEINIISDRKYNKLYLEIINQGY